MGCPGRSVSSVKSSIWVIPPLTPGVYHGTVSKPARKARRLSMSAEENKALILRVFEEGVNGGDDAVFDEVISPDYVNHSMPAPTPGLEGFKQLIGMFRAAFPDLSVTVVDVVAEGDRVATRGTMSGTHRGDFMGVPATAGTVEVPYIDIWRVEGGKGVENWVQMDMLGMMQQLGVVPMPEQATS